jgi:hypothetical protein
MEIPGVVFLPYAVPSMAEIQVATTSQLKPPYAVLSKGSAEVRFKRTIKNCGFTDMYTLYLEPSISLKHNIL